MRRNVSWIPRASFAIAVVFGLTVAVPPGQPEPAHPSRFPLAGLVKMLTAKPTWALDTGAPAQPRGGSVAGAHEVGEGVTRADGGAGRPAGTSTAALEELERPVKADEPQGTTPLQTGYVEGVSTWLETESSETTDRFRNPDGSLTNRVYQSARNFRDSTGRLRKIDPTLQRRQDGRLHATAAPVQVSFAGFDTAQWGGGATSALEPSSTVDPGNELAEVTFPGGERLAYGLAGASIGGATVRGATVTYPQILPGTDAELVATGTGIKETLILRERGLANSWVFSLRLNGLTPQVQSDGSIALLGGQGTPVAVIPRGYMQDAKVQPDGEFTTSQAVSYELITLDGAPALRVTADRAWLDDPARVYPVRVDPSAQLWDDLSDVYVDATSVQDINSLGVGCYGSPCDRRRAFLSFRNFGSYAYGPPDNSLYGMRITGANLHIYHTWSHDCPSTREVHAYRVNQAWAPSNMPNGKYPGAALGEKIGMVYISNNYPACENDEADRTVGKWWTIPVTDLRIFNDWSMDHTKNHGIALVSDNDDDLKGWKRFTSRNHDPSYGSYAPYIDFTWEHNIAPQIERQFPAHGYSVPTLNPELIVSARDPDAWPNATLKHRFELRAADGTTVIANSGEITSSSWRVPDGALKWGESYWWNVQSYDGRFWSDGDMQAFFTRVPQPPITSSLSQNGGHGFTPTTGNYTTSAVDAPITTVGPPLAVNRSYNSRDPRTTNAFGAGWSTIADSRAVEGTGQVTLTYPTGQNVAFGRNPDGTFSSPQGRFSTFRAVSNPAGYEQIDKEGTRYLFTSALTTGVYGLTSITDVQGRALLVKYAGGKVSALESQASGRKLNLAWTADGKHVERVYTDPVNPGDTASANTWTYTYSGDKLMTVCPPTSATECHRYEYGVNTLLPTAVMDAGPHTYLRLDDAPGAATAASSVQSRETGIGVYSNVTLGQAGRAGSATVAQFNGASSSVAMSGKKLPLGAAYQSVSVWFKTAAPGVIYSYQSAPVSDVSAVNWNPALYVDIDGKLRGKLWTGSVTAIVSPNRVDNNQWHHAALVGAGNTQTLYLDGAAVGTFAGEIKPNGVAHAYLGAGKWQVWERTTGDVGYFNGQISDFAWYDRPLSESAVKLINASGQAAAAPLARINRPSGGVQAEVVYTSAGAVKEVKDANGGVWKVAAPAVAVNESSYASSVLAAAPTDYFRMNESGVTRPINEVNGGDGLYSSVTLGVDGGPFGNDVDVASFNGTSSFVALPARDYPNGNKAHSVSLWFRTTGSGVLFGAQSVPVTQLAAGGWQPGLYVGTDGKLHGGYWFEGQSVSAAQVNDGAWHHAALTSNGTTYSVYLDGAKIGSRTTNPAETFSQVNAFVGAGQWKNWPGTTGDKGFFSGQIGEFAHFDRELKPVDIAAQYAARDVDRSAGAAPYLSAALAAGPVDHFRLAETSGTFGANQVAGGPQAGYANLKLGVDGPFSEATSAVTFSGSSSYVELPARDMPTTNPASISLWFNAPPNRFGPLYSYQTGAITDPANTSGYVPALYIGTDGKLRGKFWDNGDLNGLVTTETVNDGNWHHVVLSAGSGTQTMYLDGVKVGSFSAPLTNFGATRAYLGAGKWEYWGAVSATVGWFTGQIAEFGFYAKELTAAQVTGLYSARDKAVGVPSKKVKVTDPAGGVTTHVYDINDGRQLEQIDAGGGRTTFGYDSGGFLYSVTDPNGNVTIEEHDKRGNTITRITCQDRSAGLCSTEYRTYFLDETKIDPRNDKVTTVRDGRSSSKDDTTYLTTYTYDEKGNQTEVKDPLGRITRTQYTTGGVIQANLTGLAGTGRYLRVNGTLRGTTAGFSLWDLEVFDPNGKELATHRPATSSSVESSSLTAPNAVDGDPATRWSSVYTDSQWIHVDLGAPKSIDRVKLNWETAYGKNYTVDVSNDGTTWTTLRTVTGQALTYVPAGLAWRTTTPGGRTETVSYLASGDVDRTADTVKLVTAFGYDRLGRATSKTEFSDSYPNGLRTTYEYDRKSRLTVQREPAVGDRVVGTLTHTRVTTAVYNADDQITTKTVSDATGGDPARPVTTKYNAFGQKEWETDPLGHKTSYRYDALGRVIERTQPDLSVVSLEYNANGLPTLVKAGTQQMESRAYDKGGRLAKVVDAMGWETLYAYTDDNLTAKVTRRDPSTGAQFVTESNTYDAAGNLVSRATNNGATVTSYVVDAANRNLSQTVDPNGVKRTMSYQYGLDNTLVSVKLSDGSPVPQIVDYTYDAAGRTLSETVSQSGTAGLVGRWKLDETSGTAVSPATGNAHGTASSVTWSSDHGGSAVFNGGPGITVADQVIDTTQSYTVAAWIKLTGGKNGNRNVVSVEGNRAPAFLLGYGAGDDKWRMRVCATDVDSASCPGLASNAVAPLDQWTHLAASVNAANGAVKLYVNGALQGTVTIAASKLWRADGALAIGRTRWNGGNSDGWMGGIDDVQVYQTALQDSQVTNIYNGTWPGNVTASRTSWRVDQRGLPTAETGPNGDTTYFSYDEAGRLALTTSPAVNTETDGGAPVFAPIVESVAYNTFDEVVESRDGRGRHTYAERDKNGRITSTWLPQYLAPGATTPTEAITRYEYDSMGRTTASIDPLNNRTSYEYDHFGHLRKVTAPDTGVTEYTYNLLGQALSQTDPTGARAEATYDFLGRPLTSTQIVRQTGQSHTTTMGYHPEGFLASVTAPGRAATTLQYNKVGERTRVTDGKGNATQFGYDFAGRQSEVVAPDLSRLKVTYDYAGRPVTQQRLDAAGTVLTTESATYDRAGNMLSSTDARGTTMTYGYDAMGDLTQVVQPVSATESITASFGYDASGNRTRFTDGRGNRFITTYNSWDLPESRIEPGGATFTTVYDAAARPVELRAPGGVTQTSAYDSMDRLTRVTGTGAEAATADRVFGYDLAGRTTSLSGPGGDNVLVYDDRGLLTSVTGPSGNSAYTYTPDGLLATRQDAAGATSYEYDEIGRLSRMSNVDSGQRLDYAYNSMSLVEKITYGGNGNQRAFGYDPLHRLSTDTLSTSAGTLVGKIEYAWDDNSNLTHKTTTGFAGSAVNDYTYDLANRLTSWSDGSATTAYAYDKAGNRVQAGSRTFGYNERNQLVSSNDGTTYAYTPRGTLSGTTVGTVTLQTRSDALDQVIQQYSSETQFSEYAYDGLGRVVKPGFAYTGLGNDLAADPTGTYVRDAANDVVGVSGSYAWTDLHSDVVAQFGATSATLTGSATYDPFGKVLATSGMQGSLGYQSEWTDNQTGRVNMHARWYNPDTGRFDSRDAANVSPVPDSGSANRYAYAGGNPMSRVDPSGNDWMENCRSVGGCIVQGFVNSFDVISTFKKAWSALSNIEQTVKSMAKSLKDDAARWRNKVRGMMPSSICRLVSWFGGCDKAATIAGWACALSGICEVVADCVGGQTLKCAEHVGEALAEVFMGILSGGAAAAAKFTLKRLIDRFDLPGNNRNGDSNSGGGGTNRDYDSDIDAEKRYQRDQNRNNNTPAPTKKTNNNKGTNNKSGGGKTTTSKPPRPPAPPKPRGVPQDHSKPPQPPPPPGADRLAQPRHELKAPDRSVELCPEMHSFDPATPVLMADGTTKPISQVKLGDTVAATDPETGQTTPQAVTALHVNLDRALTTVTMAAIDGDTATGSGSGSGSGEGNGDRSTRGPTATLHTTQNHPFWDVTAGEWVEAKDLKPGASVVTGPDGELQRVVAVTNTEGAASMRDLTVANIHTYYVMAADTPVLVHNCGEDLYDHGGTTRYGALDDQGRATFASTVLRPDGIPRGTPAARDWEPPGWSGDGTAFNEARGHLLGNKLGGLGTGHAKRHNIVTLQQNPLNSPFMRDEIERMVYMHVMRYQEVVQYTATAIYGPAKTAPIGVRIEAYGNAGFELDVSLINPGGS